MAIRLIAGLAATVVLGACGTSLPTASASAGKVRIVAAENFWGSIAGQIGGDHATVTSIVSNPATDPHDYEATPDDARTIATARYVIANGAGYDPWVQQLVDANPVAGRTILVVADLLGKKEGDNPHFWYSPAYVQRFIDRVAADLGRLDHSNAAYYTDQAGSYKTTGLQGYNAAIAMIRDTYAGAKVGATESVFSYLADALGLELVTPYSYLKAVGEGQDPSAADKAEVEREISGRLIKVLIFNSQNSTPDVQGLVAKAHEAGIPVVPITETLTPGNTTFQAWQTGQLQDLLRALGG